MHYALGGQTFYNPRVYSQHVPRLPGRINEYISTYAGGRWQVTPRTAIKTAFKGGNLAATIAQGNFLTRNFRQKPIVGLQTATHRRLPSKSKIVEIPSVSSRRTKNNLLVTTKAMPFKTPRRVKRPKNGKRKYKKKKRIPLALPRSRVVRMRVVARGSITANAGALGIVKMKANSLNDPTTDFGATLPLGLDQWASQYQKYIVLGCKVKARFIPVTHTGPVACGLHLADNNTALTNTDHYKELPNTSQGIVTTHMDLLTKSIKYSGKRFWRLTNIKDDSEQEATFSTTPGDPTDLAYIHVYCQDMQNANNTTIEVQVEQEFIVLLTDPITLAQSSL